MSLRKKHQVFSQTPSTPPAADERSDLSWGDAIEAVAVEYSTVLGKITKKARRGYVKQVMRKSEVVYAVWQDGENRICYCIKGANTPDGTLVTFSAFLVADFESALGMQRDWGDGVPKGVH